MIIEIANPNENAPKPRRRWLRFGLRGLFVCTALIACLAGWVGIQVNRARLEEQAIAELREVHGSNLNLLLSNPFQSGDDSGEMEMFFEGGPPWLKKLLGVDICRAVVGLTCYAPGNTFHYDGVDENGEFYIRREYKVGVTDDHMRLIARMKYLKHIAVESSPVGDAGVAHLAELQKLETLNLSTTAISDDAVETITRLPNLQHLNISRTEITDRSLEQLGKCQSLTELNVEITKVTDAGVEKLQEVLPSCQIQR